MSISAIYIPIAYFVALLGMSVRTGVESENGTFQLGRKNTNSKIALFLISVILITFSAFRKLRAPGNDEWAYRNRFLWYATLSFSEVLRESTEILFSTLVWLSTRLFSTSQGVIILTGGLTTYLYLTAIKKYCRDYSFGIVMFLLTGVFFHTFNGIQQCIAAGLFFSGFEYLYAKKKKQYCILILICTLIHTSSLVLLGLLILANMDFKEIKSIALNLLCLIAMALLYRILPSYILKTGSMTEYYSIITSGHQGVGIVRIFVQMVPTALAFYLPKEIFRKDKKLNAIANISMLNSVIYVASMMDTYIARLALFTAPFNALLFANILRYFNSDSRKILKLVTMVCYTLYSVYEQRGILYLFNI